MVCRAVSPVWQQKTGRKRSLLPSNENGKSPGFPVQNSALPGSYPSSPKLFSTKIQPVRVTALHRVAITTMLPERSTSPAICLAMM